MLTLPRLGHYSLARWMVTFTRNLLCRQSAVGSMTRNVVFIATEHDSVYAFDADSSSCTQLWKISFLGSGVTTMPYQDTSLGTPSGPRTTFSRRLASPRLPSLTRRPTPSTLLARPKKPSAPVVLRALLATSVDYTLWMLPLARKNSAARSRCRAELCFSAPFNRPALVLNNGTVYVALGSHGDIPNWQGWVMAYNASTLAQKWVWHSTVATSGSNGGSVVGRRRWPCR